MTTIMVVLCASFVLMLVVPRALMAMKTAKLKGKLAPTPHTPSAKRITAGHKTLLYFYTPTCGACRMQEPILQRLQKKHGEAIFKIDATQNYAAASAYGVLGVPFIVFVDKTKVISAHAGLQSEARLAAFLEA
jgi:thioredoxin 1